MNFILITGNANLDWEPAPTTLESSSITSHVRRDSAADLCSFRRCLPIGRDDINAGVMCNAGGHEERERKLARDEQSKTKREPNADVTFHCCEPVRNQRSK